MSTSDQHPHVADLSSGSGQLTRKQLREARLTGSTPIITAEEAEVARVGAEAEYAAPVVEVQGEVAAVVEAVPAFETPPVAEPEEHEPEEQGSEEQGSSGSHLTRRQVREQERIRTASVSVPVTEESVLIEPQEPAPAAPPVAAPRPPYPTRRRSYAPVAPSAQTRAEEQDGVDDAEQGMVPVSVSALRRAEAAATIFPSEPASVSEPVSAPLLPFASEQAAPWAEPLAAEAGDTTIESLLAGVDTAPAGEPTINPAFGQRVFTDPPETPAAASFDALVGDAGGSHHTAPNALIFQQAAAPLLSGPVASTGEILVTGSYDLPAGLGSRGHADGTADGKDVDVVLVDGELAASSSPTPIAASAAIGTIKPAGEVIRPPEPEKSNKLMLALTITAGALAVALVGALIVAITTGAFS